METVNKKILLVEDDPNFGIVLKDYLAMNNFDVVLAKNGMEGFEKFKLGVLISDSPYEDLKVLSIKVAPSCPKGGCPISCSKQA